MFQQFRNIESAFKLSRIVAIVAIICSVLFSVFTVWFYQEIIREKDNSVFIIANGKLFEAFAEERGKYWPIETKDHVKTFHHYFFTLHPDDAVIKKNINKALYLADHSATNEYKNLRESGYYSSLISANISQEIECEHIEVNLDKTPWYFRYTGKQRIVRATTITIRTLVTEGYIRMTQPSDNNPHGLMIERWRVLENTDISTSKR
ncbi:conjugative transposon protein TraK [Chitinophaga cymbidii]|uniref:Conjugative transposon protein TraK n=1 Tax=Chitinophaga cymbidii TaxID=1096750 RepID=A0A512RFM2_9BACT|nr:conjugative transposon protein TraK [Chitinophaga cymbidii]GEP94495.1 conjugative transposon protein TraK [Chitinophaga cymbidii]